MLPPSPLFTGLTVNPVSRPRLSSRKTYLTEERLKDPSGLSPQTLFKDFSVQETNLGNGIYKRRDVHKRLTRSIFR